MYVNYSAQVKIFSTLRVLQHVTDNFKSVWYESRHQPELPAPCKQVISHRTKSGEETMQTYRISAAITGMAWMLTLSGCSSLGNLAPGSHQTITLQSDPPGASVLADGAEIGISPLTFNPADAFRAGFTGGRDGLLAYRYVGKLTVRKPGCTDYVTEVDDNILSKDIDIKLECDPDYQPPAAPVVSAPETRQVMPASAEERLQKINDLHKKGLVSDDEYRQLRQRVLDTL